MFVNVDNFSVLVFINIVTQRKIHLLRLRIHWLYTKVVGCSLSFSQSATQDSKNPASPKSLSLVPSAPTQYLKTQVISNQGFQVCLLLTTGKGRISLLSSKLMKIALIVISELDSDKYNRFLSSICENDYMLPWTCLLQRNIFSHLIFESI